jgi:hypothetical protein
MKSEVHACQAGFFIWSLVPIIIGILVLFAAMATVKPANSRQAHHEHQNQ